MSRYRVVKIAGGEVRWENPTGEYCEGLAAARAFIGGIVTGARETGAFVSGDTQYNTYISIRDGEETKSAVACGKTASDAPVVSEFLIRKDDNGPRGPFQFHVHDFGRAEFLRNGHIESLIAFP